MAIVTPRRIEMWAVDRLKPYAKNARTHSGEQVDKIAASIATYGFNAPILVDSDDGIVAGHGRLAAAKSLGLKEVPVIVLDHLTDKQRRAYILADNRLAELAGWDVTLLTEELEDLRDSSFDLEVLGWTDAELDDLLDKPFEFEPATEDEQGKLDKKEPQEINCVCPSCGHEFIQQA